MEAWVEFLRLLFFILPAWLSNSAPVLLGGQWPLDGGASWPDGRRIFGKSKTWLGIAAGISTGSLGAVLLAYVLPGTVLDVWNNSPALYLLGGFLLSAGAMLGDLLGSFAKRRLNLPEGSSSFVLDQLPFIAAALALALPLSPPMLSPLNVLVLVVITYFAHRGANWWAHFAGLKKVPW